MYCLTLISLTEFYVSSPWLHSVFHSTRGYGLVYADLINIASIFLVLDPYEIASYGRYHFLTWFLPNFVSKINPCNTYKSNSFIFSLYNVPFYDYIKIYLCIVLLIDSISRGFAIMNNFVYDYSYIFFFMSTCKTLCRFYT